MLFQKFLLSTCILLFIVQAVKADYWPDPTCKKYYTADRSRTLLIVPACSFPKKQKKKIKDTCLECHAVRPCIAYVYDSMTGNKATYQFQLINQVAPTAAFISNNGQYVITIDNWGSRGWGDDVMVIYKNGILLKKYSLEDISPIPVAQYSHSISSIYWFLNLEYSGRDMVRLVLRDKHQNTFEKYFDLEVIARQSNYCDTFLQSRHGAYNRYWEKPPEPMLGYKALEIKVHNVDSVGHVVFQAYINNNGHLEQACQLYSSNPKLDGRAKQLIQNQLFHPAKIRGKAVHAVSVFAVKFIEDK